MSQGEQKNDDSEIKVLYYNRYRFTWTNDGTIQTIGNLVRHFFYFDDDEFEENLHYLRGKVLQLKEYRSDKILQEWDITKQVDDAISFEDWYTRFGKYLNFTTYQGVKVFLNGEFKFLWKESDNIRSIRSLVQFLGIDWKNSSTKLKLWQEEDNPEQYIILKEENMDVNMWPENMDDDSSLPDQPSIMFRVDVLNNREIVADLADQMRSITMNSTTRDDRRRETERERDDREHQRNEDEDKIIEGLRQMRLEGTGRPSRKRRVLPLKLRF
jgi:hypothetical protein